MKNFIMSGIVDGVKTDYIVSAESKRDAYINFIVEVLELKISTFQRMDMQNALVVGNALFDMISCDEILS